MSSNTSRIAKNTLVLYFRQILTMLVSLYTTRVVLETLGVEDYGIFTVIFGTVSLLSFLNGALSSVTSRFFAYELANGNPERLKSIFGAARMINLIVCAFVILVGATLGLWFLLNRLVIPPARIGIAVIVYQIVIVNSIVSLMMITYTAAIIVHEHINVFAKLETINVTLKLLAAFLLPHMMLDKLLVYGLLLLVINMVIFMCYKLYCMKKYPESKSGLCAKAEYIKPMLAYSGIDLYGNFSTIMRVHGTNVLLNLFFGAYLNAASGIAQQIQGAVGRFSNNLLTAFRPQIIICYASGDKKKMSKYICYAAKYGFLLLFVIVFPLYLEMPFILTLWLRNFPNYTIDFTRMILLFVLISNFSSVFISGLHAVGKIKVPNLLNGSLYLTVVPVTFFLFSMGFSPIIPFAMNVVFVFFGAISNFIVFRYHIDEFSVKYFVETVIFPCLIIITLSSIIPISSFFFMTPGFLRFFIVLFSTFIFMLTFTWLFGLEKTTKKIILNKISTGLIKCKN